MTEHVTIPADEYRRLLADAEAWRGVAEWAGRYENRRASWDISAAADWRAVASRPSFGELQRRRGRPVPYRRCDWKTCTAEGQPHRSPRSGAQIILCATHSHLGIPEDGTVVKGVAA